jgi:hypothetical protein
VPPAAFRPVVTLWTGVFVVGRNHVINFTGYKRFGLVYEFHRVQERNATPSGQGEFSSSSFSPSMGLLSVASV